MNTDARISVSLPGHPKTKKLVKRGGQAAAWNLICLFLWVSQNKPDGDLSGMSDEDIEIAANWEGEDGAFVKMLSEVRFFDGVHGAYTVHDWEEHNPWAAGAGRRSENSRAAARARWGIAEVMRAACEPHASRNAGCAKPQSPVSDTDTDTDTDTKKPKPRKRATPLPDGFAVSERVAAWASAKGYSRLPERLESFISYAKRSGKTYVDWDEAFMGAIREDWAKLNGRPFAAPATPDAPALAPGQWQ